MSSVAKTLGATDVFNASQEKISKVIRKATGGCDVAFEVIGKPRTMLDAMGDLMFEKGDLEDALENYTISMKAATRINPKGDIVAEVQRRMMNVYLVQRKAEEALAIGRRAVETCRASGEMHEIGYIERMIGQALAMGAPLHQ